MKEFPFRRSTLRPCACVNDGSSPDRPLPFCKAKLSHQHAILFTPVSIAHARWCAHAPWTKESPDLSEREKVLAASCVHKSAAINIEKDCGACLVSHRQCG